MDDPALLSFGLWIKRRRKALDLTQDALAALVGCSKDLIVKIEGDARRPSREIAALLATHLQLVPEERAEFIRCARGALTPDRLPPPSRSAPRAAFPTRLPTDRPRSNLPAQLSSFLGREQERAELHALLARADVRLVTLIGPGGIGKTRLALAVAAAALTPQPPLSNWERGSRGGNRDAGHFPDGVFFVDLAPISDPDLVVTTIAQTLGVTATGERTADQLKAALRHQRLLLLLDNFEQVLAAAPLVAELLSAAPGLKVLVTSRAVLHLSGEHEYAVPPLALPPPSDNRRLTTDDAGGGVVSGQLSVVGQYAAVQLFIARAQAVKADFVLTSTNAPAVVEICRRLDGLPLAIELAAARVKLFPPEALVNRLIAPLALLAGGPRDLPARQQTIRSTLDWSYNLLSADEQRLFRWLGVFVGGFSLEIADGMLRTAGQGVSDGTMDSVFSPQFLILDGLASLLDHSLLVVLDTVEGEPRYGMLELVREYAQERLLDAGEEQVARRCHAAFFAAWGEQVRPELHGADMIAWLARLARELGNFRGMLNWSLAADDRDAVFGLRLFGSLWELWYFNSPFEGVAIVERALACISAGDDNLAAARIYNVAARLGGFNQRLHAKQIELLERSLTLARQYDDRLLQAEALRHLGEAMREHDRLEMVEPFLIESLQLSRELNDTWQEGWTVLTLGAVAGQRGEVLDAEHHVQQSLSIFARLGHPYGQAIALQQLSILAGRRSEDEVAASYLTRSLEFMGRMSPASGFSPLIERGYLAYKRGDYQSALELLQLGYHQAQQIDNYYLAVRALTLQAVCYKELGDLVTATDRCRQAMALALANPWPPVLFINIAIVVANVAVAHGRFLVALYVSASTAAYRIATNFHPARDEEPDWEQLHERALSACRAALGDAAFDAAWTIGQALTLEQAVDEALSLTEPFAIRSC